MATLTYRTTEEKRQKLQSLAKSAGISVNRLIDDWATYAIAENEAFYRYKVMSERGAKSKGKAIEILDSKAKDKGVEE